MWEIIYRIIIYYTRIRIGEVNCIREYIINMPSNSHPRESFLCRDARVCVLFMYVYNAMHTYNKKQIKYSNE